MFINLFVEVSLWNSKLHQPWHFQAFSFLLSLNVCYCLVYCIAYTSSRFYLFRQSRDILTRMLLLNQCSYICSTMSVKYNKLFRSCKLAVGISIQLKYWFNLCFGLNLTRQIDYNKLNSLTKAQYFLYFTKRNRILSYLIIRLMDSVTKVVITIVMYKKCVNITTILTLLIPFKC